MSALALPTAALTATKHVGKQVTERVTSVSKPMSGSAGFKVGFQVQQGAPTGYGGRYASVVTININQTSGHATQTNQYTFKKNVKFTGSASVSTGSFKATFANNKGSLNMSFHGTGNTFKIGTPKGCTGSGGTGRKGTLSGTLKLNAKETGGKFGTITIKSIPATMSTATYTCSPPLVKGVALSPPPTAKTLVIASKSTSGSVNEEISVTETGTGYTFLHNYSVTGEPSTDYTYPTNLQTGTITGAGGISGTATFTGTHKSGSGYLGTLSGTSYQVTMASIGTVTPMTKPLKGYLQLHQK